MGLCVIGILAVSALLDHESGVAIWLELREDLSGSAARVAQLVRENDAMRSEIASLEAEPAALDRAIREELEVGLPGEIVVRFISSGDSATESEVTNDRGRTLRRMLLRESAERESR